MMRWLSENVDVLFAEIKAKTSDWEYDRPNFLRMFDAVIVGSGYGGAVAAYRLAKAGMSVCVLERGEEYGPGDYATDIDGISGQVTLDRAGVEGTQWAANGLFLLKMQKDAIVILGNALGGGSQINANVAMRADPTVFKQDAWPTALRDTDDPLDAHYSIVENMLEVTPWGKRNTKADQLGRLREPLERYARGEPRAISGDLPTVVHFNPPLAVSQRAGPNQHGVHQAACNGCGDCVTGCNYGAKNVLNVNYLALAVKHGARIFTGVEAFAVSTERNTTNEFKAAPGTVWLKRTRDNLPELKRGVRDRFYKGNEGLLYGLRADTVVLSAGALGSTELLQRSVALGLLDRISSKLGTRFSGNGDALAVGYDQDETVGAIGTGGAISGETPGPSIVSTIDARQNVPLERAYLLQDGIFPGPLQRLLQEALTTAATVVQLPSWGYRRSGKDQDPVALCGDAYLRSQVYLGMGHDSADGKIVFRDGKAIIEWPNSGKGVGAERRAAYMEHAIRNVTKGIPIVDPTASPLPGSVRAVLSGPSVNGPALIVHPLGGCPMADSFEQGVVNDVGAIFNGLTPNSTHSSLFVLDGSIIPTSVGANPYLTISALANRACDAIINKWVPRGKAKLVPPNSRAGAQPPPWPPVMPKPLPVKPPATSETVSITLKETLVGLNLPIAGIPVPPPMGVDVKLQVQMGIRDFASFLESPAHRIGKGVTDDNITGKLIIAIGSKADPQEDASETLSDGKCSVYAMQSGGSISILERVNPAEPWLSRTFRGIVAWWKKRGWDEIKATWAAARVPREAVGQSFWVRFKRFFTEKWDAIVFVFQRIKQVLQLANHAGERRAMRYSLTFKKVTANDQAPTDGLTDLLPEELYLSGEKLLEFAHHRNIWDALRNLDIVLSGRGLDGNVRISGIVQVDFKQIADEDMPQVNRKPDLPHAWLALAGYPLFITRCLIKSNIWDFRAPDYAPRLAKHPIADKVKKLVHGSGNPPRRFGPEQRPLFVESIEINGKVIFAEKHWLSVAKRLPNNVEYVGDGETIPLLLSRFKDPDCCDDGAKKGKGRPIVLLHGYTQSSFAFVAPELGHDFTRSLVEEGFDVWLFDYRNSAALPSCIEQHDLDEVAAIDIPAAVLRIQHVTEQQKILAFGHCMGSVSLAMWMLTHPAAAQNVESIVFSQVPPYIVAGEYGQMRIQWAAFWRDVLGYKYIDLGADDSLGAVDGLLDRLFATLPTGPLQNGLPKEQCPHEHERSVPRPDISVCKRIQFYIGRVFEHENVEAIHPYLERYFGIGNMAVLNQIAKMLKYERLVTAEGMNDYLSDFNVNKAFQQTKVIVMHGRRNQLFHIESARRTKDEFDRILGKGKPTTLIDVAGYGHFDVLVGKDAKRLVFDPVINAL
jgi:cholesterol oxidase